MSFVSRRKIKNIEECGEKERPPKKKLINYCLYENDITVGVTKKSKQFK